MPLFFQHSVNGSAKIGVWHITETENFFLIKVPSQKAITHWHKHLQHLAGRYLLQELYPDFPYHLIEIADTRKPFLKSEEYHFSISHCGDYAAVIISKNERVGIDIEMVTAKIEKIKHKFLNAEELIAIDNWQSAGSYYKSTNQLISQLTLLWSCKEAVFKWYGLGGLDFRKDIRLMPPTLNTASGIINCEFIKNEKQSLIINFKIWEQVCLAWVI